MVMHRILIILTAAAVAMQAAPVYDITFAEASFTFSGGSGTAGFRMTGPGVVFSGASSDPAFSIRDAPAGENRFLAMALVFGLLPTGSATINGQLFSGGLLGSASVSGSINIPVGFAGGSFTAPGTISGDLDLCTTAPCQGSTQATFHIAPIQGSITYYLVPQPPFSVYRIAGADFTTVPEPRSATAVLIGGFLMAAIRSSLCGKERLHSLRRDIGGQIL